MANSTMAASSSKVIRHSLEDFYSVLKAGFHIELPEETLTKISGIASEVGSPTYVRTPDFTKFSSASSASASTSASAFEDYSILKKKKKFKAHESVTNESWDTIRSFEPTKVEVVDGVEADIRRKLNMLTDKNLPETEASISELIPENDEAKLKSLSNLIFEVASGNKFFSKVYAQMFCNLLQKHESLRNNLESSYAEFLDQFTKVKYVTAQEDYDGYCRVRKEMEKRQALSSFYLNSMELGVVSMEQIVSLLKVLLQHFKTNVYLENKKEEVDELADNIMLLITKQVGESNEFAEIKIGGKSAIDFIEVIANSKTKMYKSLTNKAIFKFMDIMELLN
jgi:hypothetical protein